MAKSSKPRKRRVRGVALPYNPDTLDKLKVLGAAQCSLPEVAQSLGATMDRLNNLFRWRPSARAIYEMSAAQALERLRTDQLKLARTSATMAIFLGKQYLGQTDRRELDASAQTADDADAADAARRVRAKLAALAADPAPQGDRQGGGET